MAMDEKGLGQRLQAARLAAGMTQQVLCQKANLSYSTLTKIERGAIKSPSIFTIQNIAGALGTTLDALMGVSTPVATRQKHRSQNGVRFVYFDINGCLVRFYHRAFTRLASEIDVPAEVVETAFWHYNDQVCRGDISLAEFNQLFAKQIAAPKVNWKDYYMEAIEPIPVMQEVAAWVAENYHVGLLTNIMPGFVSEMRKTGLVPNLPYDAIIDSSEAKAIKPEAKIFAMAEKASGCKPEEILFIDDSRTNLMAAEKRGWHVLWFDDYRPDESAQNIRASLRIAR